MQAKIGLTGFGTEIFVWVALKHFSLGLSISTAIRVLGPLAGYD